MTEPLIRYTSWQSIFDIDRPLEIAETWQQFTERFGTHLRVSRKDKAPGFGPYRLEPPVVRCYKHTDKQPRDHAHRCDQCVTELTLLVFDADIGNQAAVDACDARLQDAGIARLWYTSYSHGLRGKVAYRLVVPLRTPVVPEVFNNLRTGVLYRYGIPADPRQCSGRSHFYYVPSCPSWATPALRVGDGDALDPQDYLRHQPAPMIVKRQRVVDDYTAPDEPTEPVDLEPLRDKLRRRCEIMKRDVGDQYRAGLLARMLDGKEIAPVGKRNAALLALTGALAYMLPGLSLDTYVRLLQPSIDAMQLREDTREAQRMLLGAMRCKYLADKRDAAIAAEWSNQREALTKYYTTG